MDLYRLSEDQQQWQAEVLASSGKRRKGRSRKHWHQKEAAAGSSYEGEPIVKMVEFAKTGNEQSEAAPPMLVRYALPQSSCKERFEAAARKDNGNVSGLAQQIASLQRTLESQEKRLCGFTEAVQCDVATLQAELQVCSSHQQHEEVLTEQIQRLRSSIERQEEKHSSFANDVRKNVSELQAGLCSKSSEASGDGDNEYDQIASSKELTQQIESLQSTIEQQEEQLRGIANDVRKSVTEIQTELQERLRSVTTDKDDHAATVQGLQMQIIKMQSTIEKQEEQLLSLTSDVRNELLQSEASKSQDHPKKVLASEDSEVIQSHAGTVQAARIQAEKEVAAEEAARIEAQDEEAARIQAEEAGRMWVEEEAARIQAEEAARIEAQEKAARIHAEEEAAAAEAARIRAEDEEAARIQAVEAARIMAEEEEAARVQAEEAAVEAARIKAEDEEAARIQAEEAARIMAEEEEAARVQAEEAAAVEAARITAEDEEAARIQAEEAARMKAEEEEAARIQVEEAAAATEEKVAGDCGRTPLGERSLNTLLPSTSACSKIVPNVASVGKSARDVSHFPPRSTKSKSPRPQRPPHPHQSRPIRHASTTQPHKVHCPMEASMAAAPPVKTLTKNSSLMGSPTSPQPTSRTRPSSTKAKKSAEEAVEMEKEAKYKLGAQSEQLEKRKFAPSALEKDTKEKESKHKGMAEHTAKTASSAIEKAKVKLDKSESSERTPTATASSALERRKAYSLKAQLKISTENNEKASKRESKLALEEMHSSKKASLSEGKSKESFQKSWEVTNEKEGKSERTSKDKKEHASKQKSESFIKKQQANTTQEEVAQHNLVERKDKEHVESLSEWRMNTLKHELAAERKKERVTKFRESTDKTFEIGTAAKKEIVGPNEGTIKKAKVEVNDKPRWT
jgi:hypothetical protein